MAALASLDFSSTERKAGSKACLLEDVKTREAKNSIK